MDWQCSGRMRVPYITSASASPVFSAQRDRAPGMFWLSGQFIDEGLETQFRAEYGHVFVRRDRYIIAFIFVLEVILIVVDYFKFQAVPELSTLRIGVRALVMMPLAVAFFHYFTGSSYDKGVQRLILLGMAIHNLLIATYHHPYLTANMTPGFLLAVYIFAIAAGYTFLCAWLPGTLLISLALTIQYVLLRGWLDAFDLDQVYAPFLLFDLTVLCHYTAVSQARLHRTIWLFAAQERQQKQRAEEAQIFRTRLLELVGHDLHQPLGALRYHLTAMRIGASNQNSNDAERALLIAEQVSRAIDQITDMLNTALELAQLDNQSVDARCQQQPVAPLARHLREHFASAAALFGVEVRIHGTRQMLFHDHGLMMSVLRNLVGNAIKYHNHNTSQPRVVVAFRGSQRIDVVDNGGGFSGQSQKGSTSHSPQQQAGGRSGLGLFIAGQLALKQGWQLETTNHPGHGVWLRLHRCANPAQTAPAG